MGTSKRQQFTISRDEEWDAINSAIRLEMLVLIVTIGPCSIRELAEQLDRAADGLYHHMRILVASGLVVEVDRRKVGKQTEVIYDAIARDITIDRDIAHRKTRERISRLFRTMIQHAQRMMEAALHDPQTMLEGENQNVKLSWTASWLDDRQLARVRAHQDAINEILQAGLKQRKGRLFAVLTYLAPIIRTRGSEKPTD